MSGMRTLGWAAGAALAVVVVGTAPRLHAEARLGSPERGAALAARFECNRCHDGAGLVPAPAKKHCVHCHQSIRAGNFEAPADTLARWQKDVVHLLDVPSLDGVRARLDPAWVEAFLQEPVDVRPGLGATMPRLALAPDEAKDLAAWLSGPSSRSPSRRGGPAGDAARGRRLLDEKGCGFCHRYSSVDPLVPRAPAGLDLPGPELALAMKLAPDLAHTRDRVRPEVLATWIRDPQAVQPGSPMPRLAVSDDEARDMAAYLLSAPSVGRPAERRPVASWPERLPVLERPVGFEEVNQRVFRKTCWHCHAEPAFAFGDGGAGNTGGFGFAPRRLDLSSYPAILSGSVDDEGKRRSVFKKLPDDGGPAAGLPRIVAHLVARQAEEAGRAVPGVRGMPLGLPAVTPEELQLVESWIAQGRPR